MAFDTDTRNKLARMVANARALLNDEFTQQLQEIFGIQPDGKITALEKLAHLDDEQRDTARVLRERVAHISGGLSVEQKPVKAAVDRMTREQSFTVLNRFAALRMCEERGLLQQCVGGGLQSKGFQVYLKTAGSGLGGQYERFRTFIFSIFDEISIDLGILFDRFSPFGLLFPREASLGELLELINREELKQIWAEDEAIGWIYQYFNSPEERKAMRKASDAPRNSRELAVRNQFFTPRYVVEFLTDNTLGRIWYEIRQGVTSLKDNCCYLVRRPNEVFLETGQESPEENEALNENLSQEELLNKITYIPFRAPKDPRDMKIMDPACGSGHFLLYAFDLLETIYEEAWQASDSPFSDATGSTLRNDFETIDKLRKAMPELILRWNLHGIDIDPRAVQIAALTLWLRAQRSWQRQGVRSAKRPRLTKSNIVCAEPMPGDENMLKEFADGLKPKVLGQLVEVIFDKMKLAGEAGSLLKVEEEIKHAVAEARKQWEAKPRLEQVGMFPEIDRPKSKQQELQFDVRDIDDAKFWDRTESLILQSLQKYSERTENGLGNSRKMFAEDAAQGFAFIDFCTKRFDVTLMNPPFGKSSINVQHKIKLKYPDTGHDLYSAFMERGLELLDDGGLEGAITSRTYLHLVSFQKFRQKLISLDNYSSLSIIVEMGIGVLDGATVRPALSIARNSNIGDFDIIAFGLRGSKDYESDLIKQVEGLTNKSTMNKTWIKRSRFFYSFPGKALSYWSPQPIANLFDSGNSLGNESVDPRGKPIGNVRVGLTTGDDFRFVRLWFEIKPNWMDGKGKWQRFLKGGEFRPFENPSQLVVNWKNDGNFLKNFSGSYFRNEKSFGKAGIVCPYISDKGIGAQPCPNDHIFGHASRLVEIEAGDKKTNLLSILFLLNTTSYSSLLACLTADRKHESGILASLPFPNLTLESTKKIAECGKKCIDLLFSLQKANEVSPLFRSPFSKGELLSLSEFHHSFETEHKLIIDKANKILTSGEEIFWDSSGIQNNYWRDFIELASEFRATESGSTEQDNINSYKKKQMDICNCEPTHLTDTIISYYVGCCLGRWDIRYATGEKKVPDLQDPFNTLPICPPGMLQGTEGLPASSNDVLKNYPINISWEGVLVDEEGHPEDIVARVCDVNKVITDEKSNEIEMEICENLRVANLRDYFRKPSGFFHNHLKRYSISRRKAPIYWPLSTETGSYTLWLYYHRLTDQTLFTCVNDYVNPKIETIAKDIERLQRELSERGNSVKRGELEKLQEIYQELIEFRKELLRVAKLPYKPNLNDGILITAAPLWKLFECNQNKTYR